jgi:type II secretory pathway pseudopilin PulG
MKIFLCHQRERGLTLVELLVIIGVIAIMAILVYPGGQKDKDRALRIQCLNNLKQIGLATRVWEGDNGGKYPWSIPGTNGGTMEFVTSSNEWRHFQVMSNELSTPRVLVCPADVRSHVHATNFTDFNNSNMSFFINLDCSRSNQDAILSGDHNLTNGTPIRNGILELTTNNPVGWTAEMHKNVGNLLLSDGSVQQVSRTGLRDAIVNAHSPTNHLQMPVLTP